MQRYRSYIVSAACVAALLSVLEIVRLVAVHGGPTKITTLGSAIAAAWLLLFDVPAALTLGLRRSSGFLWGTFAAIASIAEGIVLRASGDWFGAAYMIGGLVILGCMIKSLAYFRWLAAPSTTVPVMAPARA